MRRWSVIVAVLVSSCGAAFAQTTTGMAGMGTTSPPALGATSPLGTLGANGSSGNSPTGLPLGATEVYPGGLSPAPLTGCTASTMGISSSMGTNSTFDDAGLGATGSTGSIGAAGSVGLGASTSGCTPSAAVSPNGTASPLSTPGTISSTLDGGTIPLGATELNSGGVSPFVTIPAPNSTTPGMTPGMTTGP